MSRPRKGDSGALVGPVVDEFAQKLGQALERFIMGRIAKETKDLDRGRPTRRKRPKALCYFPGCKNVAAPRFSMFCAALHKGISRADKDKYRAAHLRAAARAK